MQFKTDFEVQGTFQSGDSYDVRKVRAFLVEPSPCVAAWRANPVCSCIQL
jgi:hypothetical protein